MLHSSTLFILQDEDACTNILKMISQNENIKNTVISLGLNHIEFALQIDMIKLSVFAPF